MRIYNCDYCEFKEKLIDEKIIIFGIGDYFHFYMEESFPYELRKNVSYFIDNNTVNKSIHVWEKDIPIYDLNKIIEEDKCSIVLGSTNYMSEMYYQLLEMGLENNISCFIYPLVLVNSIGKTEKIVENKIFWKNSEKVIPKVIHSFWFSGDEKPEEYQKCIDSWKKYCPDYKICEWNMDNYDYTKNQFMYQAIKTKKWAFASDFARLDVLYHQGGIYMDMDVELIKPLDDFLANEAFFTFDVNMDIDLGTFAAHPGNLLIESIMKTYEDLEFSDKPRDMNWFCQPRFIRPVLQRFGLKLNGDTQIINNMIFLSREYLSPKDSIVYELSAASSDTYAIHHYNAGWKDNDYRYRRILNNRKLLDELKQMV